MHLISSLATKNKRSNQSVQGDENQQENINKIENSSIEFANISHKYKIEILTTKGLYFKLNLSKNWFADLYNTKDDMYGKMGNKNKVKYYQFYSKLMRIIPFISQLDRVSQLEKRKIVFKEDFKCIIYWLTVCLVMIIWIYQGHY